jgi:hypothetical protein
MMCENQQMLIDIDNDDEWEEPTVFEKMDEKNGSLAHPSVHGTRMLAKFL